MRPYGRAMTDTTLTPSACTTTTASPPVRLWSRAFAVIYDPSLWIGEVAGMRRRRRELLATATGRTLEIGGGTGLNLAHYPSSLPELIVAEPEATMRRRLVKRAARAGRRVRVVDAPAERLPFEDASIDTVVSTLVLCTVDDPAQALREIARVLRPGGRLLFIEHVRSDSRALAWLQDRLAAPWKRFAEGCRCNRPTATLMAATGLAVDAGEARWSAMPPIVRPLITGCATPAEHGAHP